MSKQRITVLLDAQVKRDLEALVPLGKRSRMINDLLRKELILMKRRKPKKLMALREKTRTISDHELLEILREDRRSH